MAGGRVELEVRGLTKRFVVRPLSFEVMEGEFFSLLLLRPERFRVAAGGGDMAGGNRFTASVLDVTYLGEDLHLRVLASEREPLLVAIKNRKDARAIVSDVAIDLVIDPEDIHVLRR